MTSAASFSADVPAVSQQNTEELIRKIKAISSTSLNLKDRPAADTKPSSEPSKRSVSSTQTSLRPKSPRSHSPKSPKIRIIYSVKTHQRLPSPPPSCLKRTFPCPPEIYFPNETKIQLPKRAPAKSVFPPEDCVETTTATPFSEDIKASTDGSKLALPSSSRVSAYIVNLGALVGPTKGRARSVTHHLRDMKTFGLSEPRTCSRSRRGRGILWTPLKATNPTRVSKSFHVLFSQTRLELSFCDGTGSTITVNLGKLTVSPCNKPTIDEADGHVPLPRWLERLSERNEESFHLDSALEYRVYYSDHPRLYDKFVSEAFARLHAKISCVVRNEVDWDNLRQIWD
jgi:hypothetical protein